MARYREIADDLRTKIKTGVYPVGGKLPSISDLQGEYAVSSLNTIRAAQQILVDEGMLDTRQGVGAFVTAAESPRELDVTAALTQACGTLTIVLAALDAKARHTVTFDLLADDDTEFVLTDALGEYASRQRAEAADDPDSNAESRIRWAECAEAALALIEKSA